MAKDFAYKLLKIGLTAIAESDTHVLLATVQALGEDDLLLAISFSGERREINLAVEVARKAGAKTLALTSFSPNPLQQQADHCLYTLAELPRSLRSRSTLTSGNSARYCSRIGEMACTPNETGETIRSSPLGS